MCSRTLVYFDGVFPVGCGVCCNCFSFFPVFNIGVGPVLPGGCGIHTCVMCLVFGDVFGLCGTLLFRFSLFVVPSLHGEGRGNRTYAEAWQVQYADVRIWVQDFPVQLQNLSGLTPLQYSALEMCIGSVMLGGCAWYTRYGMSCPWKIYCFYSYRMNITPLDGPVVLFVKLWLMFRGQCRK